MLFAETGDSLFFRWPAAGSAALDPKLAGKGVKARRSRGQAHAAPLHSWHTFEKQGNSRLFVKTIV